MRPPRKPGRITLPKVARPLLVSTALVSLPSGIASCASQPVYSDVGEANWRRWNELDPKLLETLESLRLEYEWLTRQFVCTESTVHTRRDGEDQSSFCESCAEYSLLSDSRATFRAERDSVRGCARRRRCEKPLAPEPLEFISVLAPTLSASLRHAVTQTDTGLTRLFWSSAAPWTDGVRVSEWSGSILVDPKSRSLHAIEATPNFQAQTLAARQDRYRTSTRVQVLVLGFVLLDKHLAPRPDERRLVVSFAPTRLGWLPEISHVTSCVAKSRSDQAECGEVLRHYSDYRFFEVQTESALQHLER
jgi:hypothetical protein